MYFLLFEKDFSTKIMTTRFPTPFATPKYFRGSHHLNTSCKRDDLALGPHMHQLLWRFRQLVVWRSQFGNPYLKQITVLHLPNSFNWQHCKIILQAIHDPWDKTCYSLNNALHWNIYSLEREKKITKISLFNCGIYLLYF